MWKKFGNGVPLHYTTDMKWNSNTSMHSFDVWTHRITHFVVNDTKSTTEVS